MTVAGSQPQLLKSFGYPAALQVADFACRAKLRYGNRRKPNLDYGNRPKLDCVDFPHDS